MDELPTIKLLESTHTIDIESFVPRKDVDEIYLDESCYLVPEDKVGIEAFAVIGHQRRTDLDHQTFGFLDNRIHIFPGWGSEQDRKQSTKWTDCAIR